MNKNTTSQKLENKLIPELRFPEFKNDGEWISEEFDKIYTFLVTNSFSRENLNYISGSVKNIHYGDIHTKFSTLFDITKENVPFINSEIEIDRIRNECYCKEGDLIFADASEDLSDIGKSIEVINLNKEKLLSGLHTLLARQYKSKLAIGFAGHLFLSDNIRKQIKREAQGAKVLGISGTRLSKIYVSYPKKQLEQQKIASCLSSLDELIAAQSKKLDALKEHKKGLMQNLFPQEGEKIPKFRFKEFQRDGEWLKESFSKYVKVIDGDRGLNYPKSDEYSSFDYCVFLNAKNVTKSGFAFNEINFITKEKDLLLRTGKLKRFDIVLTTRGSLGQFAFYHENVPFENIRINSGMVILRTIKSEIDSKYLFVYCLSNTIQSTIKAQGFGNAVQQLTVAVINKFPLLFPKNIKEQKKIAECFISLDVLIKAQTERIEQLKLHKKGLMQGLFPKVND